MLISVGCFNVLKNQHHAQHPKHHAQHPKQVDQKVLFANNCFFSIHKIPLFQFLKWFCEISRFQNEY